MCVTCGCSDAGVAVLVTTHTHAFGDGPMHSHEGGDLHGQMHSRAHDDGHMHSHAHADVQMQGHVHDEAPMHRDDDLLGNAQDGVEQRGVLSAGRTVALERAVLAKNDALAERNRAWFNERGIVAFNLVSSPGSGKTTLLERTIRELGVDIPLVVIEGDQATENDSARIRAAGARALQVNTGTGCHLEAEIVGRALDILGPQPNSVVMIENVGNLVCPALFDLGEHAKVAILSVTEGDDKPEKYPHMFAVAELFIINKIDLLPYVDFNVERCIAHARAVRPGITTIQLSARTGENLAAWYDWIRAKRPGLGADR